MALLSRLFRRVGERQRRCHNHQCAFFFSALRCAGLPVLVAGLFVQRVTAVVHAALGQVRMRHEPGRADVRAGGQGLELMAERISERILAWQQGGEPAKL